MLDAYLCRAENVTSGMQGDTYAMELERFAVIDEAHRRASAKSRAEDPLAVARSEIKVGSPSCVIAVRVCDNGARHGHPRIDVEIARLAIETSFGDGEQHGRNLRVAARAAKLGVMLTRSILVSALASACAALPARSQVPTDTSRARVVLLGTGTPIPDPERSGPGLAIVVHGASYIVDAGPGIVRRATAAARRDAIGGLRVANLRRVFITHLHSDHTLGLPDLMLTPAVMHRKGPLYVYGPPGTRAMVTHLLEAYREDIDLRIHGLERGDSDAYRIVVQEVTPGVVYRDSNVTVRAFRVLHGSWKYAYAYRFDADGRSIVVSGDTKPSQSIVDACNGCDVLVHEVYSKKGFDRLPIEDQKYHSNFHTSGVELGDLARRARPKLLVLSHLLFFGESADEIVAETRSRFAGNVVAGVDLGVF